MSPGAFDLDQNKDKAIYVTLCCHNTVHFLVSVSTWWRVRGVVRTKHQVASGSFPRRIISNLRLEWRLLE